MSITGPDDGPPYRLGVAIADIVSGMFAAQGILAALLARERTGRGQRVDIAMLDSVAALLTYQAGNYFATGAAPTRLGNRHPTHRALRNLRGGDGDFVLAVGNDEQFRRLCTVLGPAGSRGGSAFRDQPARVANYDALKPALDFGIGAGRCSDLIERASAPPACPCGAFALSRRCSPIRRSPRATWSRRCSTRRLAPCACSARR